MLSDPRIRCEHASEAYHDPLADADLGRTDNERTGTQLRGLVERVELLLAEGAHCGREKEPPVGPQNFRSDPVGLSPKTYTLRNIGQEHVRIS